MTTETFIYSGTELDIFSQAISWKRYWASKLKSYIGNRVLEVGAGIGGTTRQLAQEQREIWLGLEPDKQLFDDLIRQKDQGLFPDWCDFSQETVGELPINTLYDSILYIDVLEHIENDQHELELASRHLNISGYLIVLSPAYPSLFTEFDAAIGHYRRYTRKSLPHMDHAGLRQIKTFYLDSIGLLTSLTNKLLLHSSQPTAKQIGFWDKYIVPVSKLIDPIIRYSAGRSIVSIWQKF